MARFLALVVALVALLPAGASAQDVGAAAAGLARSPLYVDPSLRSAITEQERTQLESRLAEQRPPVLVALVPVVPGDAVNGKPRALLTVLRRRTGQRDAILVTVKDGSLTADLPDDEDEQLYAASSYTNLVEHDYGERIATTLNRYLDALADPDIVAKAEQAREDLDDRLDDTPSRPSVPAAGAAGADGGFPTALVVVIGVALLSAASLLVVRGRRGARPAPDGPLFLPDHVFEAAHGSRRRELRRTVENELVELVGELDAQPVPDLPAAQEHYQRALDARDAARRITEDPDASDADLVGALVLEDVARQALADALGRGTKVRALCALNPLHGRSAGSGRWGSSPKLPLCQACLADVRAKRAPEVLDDGGRPYLERDTVWARTAFGALVSNLPAEVVRDRVER
ncbi:hypothetical protein DVA67_021790 [Solirubrobacter sp. CPCC 204708]|uniref:TPM domain-containing protein n=1 Tax=Solirubrobacter deserti TaxID=2282478 RepID=A0ABT4REX3_9ACTN|nr:hypothetical protein [Solirubrobacter deserti]MBE2318626.1 hypothetical protein [Solirubrobacter deserti]MDA0137084.1 hypothetical protein [Solirubrobacter deserti]